MKIGLVHPGEMGAALGRVLRLQSHEVIWVSAGRSMNSCQRALDEGLIEAQSLQEMAGLVQMVFCVCPPHAAAEVASELSGFQGIYVDVNAIAPAKAHEIASSMPRFVDGSIIGPPPGGKRTTYLYLAGGSDAVAVAELFVGTDVVSTVISETVGSASALKMAYAGWSKGSAALLLAVQSAARRAGVEDELMKQWAQSDAALLKHASEAQSSAARKGWRWQGEMDEVAAFFSNLGLPDGFHTAAAEIYGEFHRSSPPAREGMGELDHG